ncbi:hypothetical protein SynBIOSU31_03325 [Synechococcus sp. BIOS-U3-1]|nr:hypothetical protein SynBIOSU31_03325 [Synechococcus sp. BIOS-U3-1]
MQDKDQIENKQYQPSNYRAWPLALIKKNALQTKAIFQFAN